MATTTQWSAIDLEFWADIDGTEVECVEVEFTYAMNTIPIAGFRAAVGRDVHSGAASTAHALADTKIMTPVKIYAKCTNRAGAASIAMPVGKKLVFEGYITGAALARTATSFTIVFGAVHWLSDLTYGSVLSSISHPNNPADLAFNANWGANAQETVAGTDGDGGNTVWSYNNSANDIVTPAAVELDLWGEAIKPWLLALAKREFWGLHPENNSTNLKKITVDAQRDGSRPKVIDALNKIVTDPALALVGVDKQIAHKIADDITCQSTDLQKYTLNSLATTDFWNLIVSLSTSYIFSIIPFPDKVKVVPFIEGYRTHFKGDHALGDFSIAARDISNIDLKLFMPRRIGGFVVYGSPVDNAVSLKLNSSDEQDRMVIGSFVPSADPGMIMMREAPRWLNGTAQATASGSDQGLSGNVTSNGVAHPGDTGSSDLAPIGDAAEADATDNKKVNEIINKYAQALYCCEALRTRYGKIVGPLRLDICPGSTIKFEGVSEKYTPGTQPIGHARFAHVTSVTCYVNAKERVAKTTYDVAHIRTTEENSDDATSIAGHPLYTTVWAGDALI